MFCNSELSGITLCRGSINRMQNSISFLLVIGLFFIDGAFAASPNQAEIKKIYYNWCSTIRSAKGNPQKMVKFYEPHNAVVYPISSSDLMLPDSPKTLYSREGGLYGYFAFLTGLPNIKCTTKKLATQITDNEIKNSGLYTFSYTDKNGETKKVVASFTFIYQKTNNQYLIIKQESIVLP